MMRNHFFLQIITYLADPLWAVPTPPVLPGHRFPCWLWPQLVRTLRPTHLCLLHMRTKEGIIQQKIPYWPRWGNHVLNLSTTEKQQNTTITNKKEDQKGVEAEIIEVSAAGGASHNLKQKRRRPAGAYTVQVWNLGPMLKETFRIPSYTSVPCRKRSSYKTKSSLTTVTCINTGINRDAVRDNTC